MNIRRLVSALFLAIAVVFFAEGQNDSGNARALKVTPYPNSVSVKNGFFDAQGAAVICDPAFDADTKSVIEDFGRLLAKSSLKAGKGTIRFSLNPTLGKEEYEMTVSRRSVQVSSSSFDGVIYAIASLKQLLPNEIYTGTPCEGKWEIPCCSISDKPRFGYRGAELDCSRHFFSVADVKKMLDVMAVYKLNRFHWHLTDDHGWRVEIKKYPLLTEVGAWRDGTMREHDMNSNDGVRYGGFYTQEQIKDVVAYAKRLGIEIVPEIDLPAHMVSALAAYPSLGCTGGPYKLMTVWDIAPDVLCVGKDSTFDFLEGVFDEVCGLFPYEYIHIGGDECPKGRWKECPSCQARIRALGLKDTEHGTAEQYLQNYVTARVQKYLALKGKKVIGWDEILEGELQKGATIMSWRGVQGGITAVENGFDAIMTPCDYCYLDYCQSDKPELEPVSIGHYVPVEKCYSYEPCEGMEPHVASHILGLQGNVWTEFIATISHVEYMLLPRIIALGEVMWCQPEIKNYPAFREDLIEHQFPLLKSMGYIYCNVVNNEY